VGTFNFSAKYLSKKDSSRMLPELTEFVTEASVADLLWLFRSFYLCRSSVESFAERDIARNDRWFDHKPWLWNMDYILCVVLIVDPQMKIMTLFEFTTFWHSFSHYCKEWKYKCTKVLSCRRHSLHSFYISMWSDLRFSFTLFQIFQTTTVIFIF
jgi:hypothetical protein